jgi:hypothetical protein
MTTTLARKGFGTRRVSAWPFHDFTSNPTVTAVTTPWTTILLFQRLYIVNPARLCFLSDLGNGGKKATGQRFCLFSNGEFYCEEFKVGVGVPEVGMMAALSISSVWNYTLFASIHFFPGMESAKLVS